jgi:hypothetical protein
MMKKICSRVATCGALFLATLSLAACVQMPTERHAIVDVRPQIAFRASDGFVRSARVVVDGLDMGAVSDFLEGVSALRLVPGTHTIKIAHLGRNILDEKFYAGDGVNRVFIVTGGGQ